MKNAYKTTWNTTTVVFLGVMVAVQIVLTRFLGLDLGPFRISFGSVVTILSGLWFGPIGGALVGLVSDLIGCVIKGYAPNPFITVAAICWGLIPGLARPILFNVKNNKVMRSVVMCVTILITGAVCSLVLTTAGLVLMMGYNFYAIMPGRLFQFVGLIPCYCILTILLYYSPLTSTIQRIIKER